MNEVTKRKVHKLSTIQTIKVSQALSAIHKQLDNKSYQTVAEELSKSLGFTIVPQSLKFISKEMNIYWKKPKLHRGITNSDGRPVSFVARAFQKIRELENDNTELKHNLKKLCGALDMPYETISVSSNNGPIDNI